MKNVNFKVLALAIFDTLFYSTIIIAISVLMFSCSKADDMVQPAANTDAVVVLEVEGKEYTYTGTEVLPAVITDAKWHNVLCTEEGNTGSIGFRVGGMYADSLYILKSADVVATFKAGSVTYSNTNGLTALHVTEKNNGAIKGYFRVPVRNNATGANSEIHGRFSNLKF